MSWLDCETRRMVNRQFVKECLVFDEEKPIVPVSEVTTKESQQILRDSYNALVCALKIYHIAAWCPNKLDSDLSYRSTISSLYSLKVKKELGEKNYHSLFGGGSKDSLKNHLYLSEIGKFYYNQYKNLLTEKGTISNEELVEYGKKGAIVGTYSSVDMTWFEYFKTLNPNGYDIFWMQEVMKSKSEPLEDMEDLEGLDSLGEETTYFDIEPVESEPIEPKPQVKVDWTGLDRREWKKEFSEKTLTRLEEENRSIYEKGKDLCREINEFVLEEVKDAEEYKGNEVITLSPKLAKDLVELRRMSLDYWHKAYTIIRQLKSRQLLVSVSCDESVIKEIVALDESRKR